MSDAQRIADALVECFRAGGKVLVCGNGGSAAQAQHLAGELLGRFAFDREPLPAVALAADVATLTCIANDYGYQEVFARQVRALAKPEDVLVCLTTSGRSPNVTQAWYAAGAVGARRVVVASAWAHRAGDGDVVALIEGGTAAVQEQTLALIHEVCGEVERQMFERGAA